MSSKHNRQTHAENLMSLGPDKPLKMLTPWQVRQIDQALASLGASAEVRLVKMRGKLRFIKKLESEDAAEPFSHR